MSYIFYLYDQLTEAVKKAIDMLSIGTAIAGLFTILPKIATGLSVLWLLMRMYETWLNIKEKRKALKE